MAKGHRAWNRTHGMTETPTWNSWKAMVNRCRNPNSPNFARYGGRGITVCDRWLTSFAAFLADMGERPSLEHSIDRIDNSKGYEPGNCRWATAKQQCRNTSKNVRLTFEGRTQCVSAWAEELGVSVGTLFGRIARGWPDDRVISKSMRPKVQRSLFI